MRRFVLVMLLLSSCTSATPRARPTPASFSPSPSAGATTAPAMFDAARVVQTTRELVSIGSREDTSPGFKTSVAYVTNRFAAMGYVVSHQNIAIPAGNSVGHPVTAGYTTNTIAVPPGFDPSKPYLIVGAHLDTVAGTAGANDNASGAAMILELARLATMTRTALPIEWIEWGGEERRLPGNRGALFGSRAYLDRNVTNSAAIRGVLAVDMVGNGPFVRVCRGGKTPRGFVNALLRTAVRIGVPAREEVVTRFFSDHTPFENVGFTVAWLWSGEHPSVHSPRDTIDVIQKPELERIGRVAWETLRTLRL